MNAQLSAHRKVAVRLARLALFVALGAVIAAVGLVKLTTPVAAYEPSKNIKPLAGPWQATLFISVNGCVGSVLVNFTLDATGSTNSAVFVYHATCGDGTLTGQSFTIQTLNDNGSGTANLTCGIDCGSFDFNIQVDKSHNIINLADVSLNASDRGHFAEGSAIRQDQQVSGEREQQREHH